MEIIKIINIVLAVFIVLLVINLIYPIDTIMGNFIYRLDTSEPECYFINAGMPNKIPIASCCYELHSQLTCEKIRGEADYACYTSKTSGIYYLVNSKALNFCKKEGYYIETS